jgi:hypothetical protein
MAISYPLSAMRALYLEPGIKPDEDLVAGVPAAMCDFLASHEASDLNIGQSTPKGFGTKVQERSSR